jgi:hypothetical protein
MTITKEAFGEGVQHALRNYGILPEEKPSLLRKAAPWLAAAAAGGLGYKYFRTPTFSKNPGLRKLQQKAVQEGFHRVVDVSHPGKFVPEAEEGFLGNLLGRAGHAWQPKVNPHTGEMNWLNKLKFILQEGTEAIPVASKKGRIWAPGSGGRIHTQGIVQGRDVEPANATKSMKTVVRGGQDVEGPRSTQDALTEVNQTGKGFEADLMQHYAPGAIPDTLTNLEPLVRNLRRGTPRQRQRAAQQLRDALHRHFKGNYALKPIVGEQSGGFFPWGEQDWGKHIEKFDKHLANPKTRASYEKANAKGRIELTGYLRDHGLLEGHTLHNTLQDPASAIAQRAIPEPLGEWRVHTMNGGAPRWMMTPRHEALSLDTLKGYLGIGDIKTKALQDYAENVLSKLPEKYRRGSWGMDIMVHRKPDGSIGHKIVEMNPTERQFRRPNNGPYAVGGGSGFLDSHAFPGIGHLQYRAATGRHTPVAATALAAPLALTAGSITNAALPDDT